MKWVADGTPSVPFPRRLRPDLVLVALRPPMRRGLALEHDERERVGLVLAIGDSVTSVWVHDCVVFDSYAAEEVRVEDWPCVLVSETDLDAVVEFD